MSFIEQPQDLMDAALRSRAVAAARGAEPFDVLISGGTLVDVVTGELRPADIGLVGSLIASVHEPGARSDAVTVVDATGAFVSPGLIDTHMHVESSMVTPATYAAAVLARGVTTIVWDPHEFGNVNGVAGVRWAADIHLTPDGRHLYACDRTASIITIFSVSEDGSVLSIEGYQNTETQPRGFNLDHSGKYLIAAGQKSHHIAVYEIKGEQGLLQEKGRYAVGQGPMWVVVNAR